MDLFKTLGEALKPEISNFKPLKTNQMKKYYNIGVFYSRKNSFSVYVAIETDDDMDDDDVIEYALDNDFMDSEDANQVIYVEEMEEDDYNQTKGI